MTTPHSKKGRPSAAVQIAGALRARIESGDLSPGEMLPSTRYLATEFKASEGSIYAAVALLKTSGHVASRQGKGVFVLDRNSLISGAERIGGITRPGDTIEWRHSIRTDAPEWAVEHIGEGECVERARVVRSPTGIREASKSWVHRDIAEIVPELDEAAPCDPTWQKVYESRSGKTVENVARVVDARIATADDLEPLELPSDGVYALLIVRNLYAAEGQTIGAGEIVCAPGRPIDIKP
jgi:DNA-binding GntR family transcriptional regulator